MPYNRICVLGGGAWGTALALNARQAGRDVVLWARESDVVATMSNGEGNPRYLPKVAMPAIPATTNIQEAVEGAEAILSVIPAQFGRASFELLRHNIKDEMPFALCSKGVEHGSHLLMTDVLSECLPQAIPAVLSGPSFAIDVAKGKPTAVTFACANEAVGKEWVASIGRPQFRPYLSNDLIGAEVGGAVKNVLAIACGIVDGLDLGKSAHAALISRGFAEMTRLGVAMGARAETLAGLCGLGDLVLTCSSPQSRNMSFGRALGLGEQVHDILGQREAVTEGVATAPGIVALGEKHRVELPICTAVSQIVSEQISVDQAVAQLLDRPFKAEY